MCDAVVLAALPGLVLALSLSSAADAASPEAQPKPNIVLILADDLGYGDLGCYGHPTIRTPNLDRMAREGQRWTSFYAGACVCTPSRAALMTGRLPIRSGMTSRTNRVLRPDSTGGLPPSELTLAEALKALGYDTACVGKWHLGHLPPYLPTRCGFDTFFGTPYSNDEARAPNAPRGSAIFRDSKVEYWDIPLMRNESTIERPADQPTLVQRYTAQAVRFIEAHASGTPFFLYLAHNSPHVPLFRSDAFAGKSPRGLYGDVVEELDWSVGQVLEALRKNGLAERSIVVFTSDNGPWLPFRAEGGSAGLLRDGKGKTWEGGMRVPMVARWPGTIPAHATVADMGSFMDLFVTSILLAGGEVPRDRRIDGVDLRPALLGKGPSPRDVMFFYRDDELYAVRQGPYKAHFLTAASDDRRAPATRHDPPLLYHLGHDPSELFNIASECPTIVSQIRGLAETHVKTIEPVENQLTKVNVGK